MPSEKPKSKWKAIYIPREQFNFIDQLVKKHPYLGFADAKEFVKDAVREKFNDLLVRLKLEP